MMYRYHSNTMWREEEVVFSEGTIEIEIDARTADCLLSMGMSEGPTRKLYEAMKEYYERESS